MIDLIDTLIDLIAELRRAPPGAERTYTEEEIERLVARIRRLALEESAP